MSGPTKAERMLPSEVWERMSTDPAFYARMAKIASRAVERDIRRLIRKDKEA